MERTEYELNRQHFINAGVRQEGGRAVKLSEDVKLTRMYKTCGVYKDFILEHRNGLFVEISDETVLRVFLDDPHSVIRRSLEE